MASKPVVVVFTGNSNTGLATVKHLVSSFGDKVAVRAVVRKKSKAGALKDLDVEIVNADITQPALLKAVFEGDVNTALWVTPNEKNRVELTKLFIDACISYGVDFPVVLSILQADEKKTTFQRDFAQIEEYCKAKQGTPVKRQMLDTGKQLLMPVILRSAFFYQNFLGSVATIQSGVLYYPMGVDGVIPHVDNKDVGLCAASIMADPTPHGGKTYNIIGEYQAGNQLASALVRALRANCKYEHVDDEIAVEAFKALGMPDWFSEGLVEEIAFYRSFGDGLKELPSDVEVITGQPATRFTTFAKNDIKPFL